jgi:hypothetical protein
MSRRCFFSPGLLLLSIFLFGPFALHAEDDPFPTGPKAGRELAAKLRAVKPEEPVSWEGILKIFNRPRKVPPVPIKSQLTLGKTNWTVTYTTAPTDTNLAEKFIIVFSTNGPNHYFYARADKPGTAPGEPKEISGAEADIPIGGSDFWLSDLGLEFLHWPDQMRLRGDIHDSRGRYVLVSTNPNPGPGGYLRVKTWIDKESDQPTQAEAFGTEKTNIVVKSFSLEKIAKGPDGKYQVKEMEIRGKGNFWSRLEINVEGEKK